ncbi:MAG: aspartate/glutamate racemase family protein [Lentisphaeria bacterium]
MKTLLVCDSGLGGLDIAAKFFQHSAAEKEWELIYFNAFPDRDIGYNDLPSDEIRRRVFHAALEGMLPFKPDLCLIACNTLSIVYEQLAKTYRPAFPVVGIINAAVGLMTDFLRQNPDGELLLLGTKTTIASGVYPERLIRNGIAAQRIRSLACPGLAKLIEQNPAASEVAQCIAQYAQCAKELFPHRPKKLAVGLCCTHYGYVAEIWQQEFSRSFSMVPVLLNPNAALLCHGSASTFSYASRFELSPGQREAMATCFASSAPLIADALRKAKANPGLFKPLYE